MAGVVELPLWAFPGCGGPQGTSQNVIPVILFSRMELILHMVGSAP